MNLQKSKNTNPSVKKKSQTVWARVAICLLAIVSIVSVAIFAFPFLTVALWLVTPSKDNQAEKDIQPFIAQIEKAGGKEICKNGDNGYGISNTHPWYEGYYEMPSTPELTNNIKMYASQTGYALSEDTEGINKLKEGTAYGGATFNPKSDYLSSDMSGNRLEITINRETAVKLFCGVSDYGRQMATSNGKVIVNISFTLPHRN